MLDLYTYKTFNGQQVSILLEELSLDYQVKKIDLMKGEQRKDSFLKINPSGRIPAIVDYTDEVPNGFVITQAMAILIYLAEKQGQFLSKDAMLRARTLEWLTFQATDISTNIFNAFLLGTLIKEPEKKAAQILKQRAISFYQVFEKQLTKTPYLAGDNYSIADISSFAVINSIIKQMPTADLPNLQRWFDTIKNRAAVIRGLNVPN